MTSNSVPALSSLLQRATIEDHEEILKACDAALEKSESDVEAQHVKAVALLKLDRFDEARLIFKHSVQTNRGRALIERAPLECAYALYKGGQPQDAAEIAAKISSRGGRHVEAQATYRVEDFARSAEIYEALNAESGYDEENDLRINSSAVDAQLEWAALPELVRKKRPDRDDLQAFETVYNAACGSIARGKMQEAELLLKRAKGVCPQS